MTLSTTDFLKYAKEQGVDFVDDIIVDGQLHRSRVAGDKSGSKNGWYICHDGDYPFCIFNTWRDIGSKIYSAGGSESLSEKAKKTLREEIRKQRRRQKQIKDMKNMKAEIECGELYKSASNSYLKEKASTGKNETHLYCVRKEIGQRGGALILRERMVHERQEGDNVVTKPNTLLIPMQDTDGRLVGMQKINNFGGKFFHPGSKLEGSFCVIGPSEGDIFVAESYSTGSTISEEMNSEVWVAFNASNLSKVTAHAAKTGRNVIVCRDDDWKVNEPIKNPGKHYAEIAQKENNCYLVAPEFSFGRGEKDTDFNDMPRHLVKECILKQLEE